ncbi:MAG: glycosyltransferase family 2 protein, partial [Mesorhizobium sp.]|nr:glycosyltransferase family 2 protein [Mesorhizobium sp.]
MFSIVLVTYNSSEVVADALRSIPPGHQVIVVDNASTDNSVEVCRSLGATVLEMRSNLGFGTACNRGADVATAESILFLNPDARLQAGALSAMQQAMLQYPDSAAFNPRVLNEDGSQFLRRRTILLPRPYWVRPPAPSGDEEIITATGAALIVRTSVFKEINGFDENIFLYYEDD